MMYYFVIEPISLGILMAILVCLIAAFFYLNNKSDDFEEDYPVVIQVFNENSRKLLSQDEKPKKTAKGSRIKGEIVVKAKKEIREIDVEKLFNRLSGIDELEPEYVFFLAAHLNSLSGQVEQLKDNPGAAQQGKTASEGRIKTQKNARVVAEGKLVDLKQEMSEMSGKLKKALASELELTEKVASTQKKQSEVAALLTKANDERSKLQMQVNKLSDDLHEAKERVAQFSVDDKAREKILSDLQAKNKDMSESLIEFEATKGELAASKKENENAAAVIKKLEASIKEIKAQRPVVTVERAPSSMEKHQKDIINKLLEEKRQWTIEEEETKKEIQTTKILVERFNAEIERFEARKVEIQANSAANESLILRQKEVIDEQANEIELLNTEKSLLKDQIRLHEVDIISTGKEAKLARENTRLHEKNEELRVRNTKMASELTQLDMKIARLMDTANAERRKVAHLLAPLFDQPAGDLDSDKFSEWLGSNVSELAARSVAGTVFIPTDMSAAK